MTDRHDNWRYRWPAGNMTDRNESGLVILLSAAFVVGVIVGALVVAL